MSKLVALRLEVNDANDKGEAWYAYFEGEFDLGQVRSAFQNADDPRVEGGSLSHDPDTLRPTPYEMPNLLSKYARLRRFYAAAAC